ncbi:MAG: HAD family hydrolase [Calditerrivibrio sp.]|nr:HAD family hydrolase [Calditerrivibrio sp.]
MGRPAVFIDRDGTINEEAGYINHINSFKIFDFVPQSLRLLNEMGIYAIVITNQGGIARDYFSEELVTSLHTYLKDKMLEKGAFIDAIYYCPHYPKTKHPIYGIDCDCRKPKEGLVKMALADFDIDQRSMFVIGDKWSDLELGERIGAIKILVKTGYGLGELEKYQNHNIQPDFVEDNLLMAVLRVLRLLSIHE